MEKVIFKHGNNNYKLVLEVTDQFNDYRQHVFIAILKLYTHDNLLIETENYIFPIKFEKVKNIDAAFKFFYMHLESRHKLSTVAYDLYLKSTLKTM